MKFLATPLIAALLFVASPDSTSPPPDYTATVVDEVTQAILEGSAKTRATLVSDSSDYSHEGALEFWSSGGLLQKVGHSDRDETYDSFTCVPKHIEVIALGKDIAVAHYYSEGSMKPKGSPAVPHYMTRASQVFVKEDGAWKVRSSHWSPISGGGGTSQSALGNVE